MDETAKAGQFWRRLDWWKIGFVCALLAFEVAREIAVVALADADTPPKAAVQKLIISSDDEIYAEGRWRRTDGGDPIFPIITTISCFRGPNTCRVAEVVISDDRVSPPTVSTYAAQFNGDVVKYEMRAGCVRYFVTIDAGNTLATSVRTKLPTDEQTPIVDCGYAEDRIETALDDGYNPLDSSESGLPEDAFLPIARLIRWFIALF